MLNLNLIRHAKTNQTSVSGKDFDRELLDKGISQSNLMGAYLQNHHVHLGKILCSAATRTKQTKSIICQHLTERCEVTYSEDLYLVSSQEILRQIQELASKDETVTVIGHNEGISALAGYLSDEYIQLRTCEMICFSLPFDSWDNVVRGTGIITLQYRPEVYLPI